MFKLGCDPEVFLKNKAGKIVSAIGKFGGTKTNPRPILEKVKRGFAIQEDNVLLEYNLPPARSFDEFSDYLAMAQGTIQKLVLDKDLDVATIASCSMPDDELRDPKAFVFGCDPDFDAWNLCMNPRPEHPDQKFRSAGGHIHIGHKLTKTQAINVCRFLDRYVGIWLTHQDPDKDRKELYGKPGSMRFKPYGLEYRTPSNWWTFQPNIILEEMYERIKVALEKALTSPFQLDKERFTVSAFNSEAKIKEWAKAF